MNERDENRIAQFRRFKRQKHSVSLLQHLVNVNKRK